MSHSQAEEDGQAVEGAWLDVCDQVVRQVAGVGVCAETVCGRVRVRCKEREDDSGAYRLRRRPKPRKEPAGMAERRLSCRSLKE
jgi:hypothetical protein